MAVDNTSASAGPFFANGTTTVFPFGFIAAGVDEISVTVNGMPIDRSAYRVTLDDTGAGSITISPPLASGTIYIESNPDFTQTTAFQRFGPYYPDFVNKPLDRSAVRDIYLLDRIKRAVVAPLGVDLLAYLRSLLGPGYQGSPGGNVMAIGLFTAAAGLTIPLGTDLVQTSGHHIKGVGPALYSSVDSSPGLPGAGQFQSANGRWFQIVINNNAVPIEQAGGVGDSGWNGATLTPGTDNLQPYYDAEQWATSFTQGAVFKAGPAVWFGASRLGRDYYFSDTINKHRISNIQGNGMGTDNFNNEIRLHWSGNRHAIVINGNNTHGDATVSNNPGSAAGSGISGVSIFNASNTSRNFHAIRPRTVWHGERIYIQWTAGNGIHMEAQAGAGGALEGNCNYSTVANCTIRAGGYGVVAKDKDVNACTFLNMHVRTCGLGGWLDVNTLGNTWIGGGIDECASATDSGYVTYAGRTYLLVSEVAGIGGSTVPGTNPAVWESYETWPGFPLMKPWINGGTFTYAPAIGIKGTINRSKVVGPYTESYICDMSGSGATAEGGQVEWTRGSSAMFGAPGNGNTSNRGWSFSYRLPAASAGYSGDPFNSVFRGALGQDPDNGVVLRWGYSSDSTVDYFKALREVSGDTVFDFGNGNGGSWGVFTGRYTMRRFGGTVATSFATKFDKLLIAGVDDLSIGVLDASGTSAPTVGIFRRGDYIRNRNIASGAPKGWGCSVAGALTPTVWAPSITYYDRGNIVTNGGNKYVNVNAPARVASTAYSVGQMFSNRGKDYKVTTAGTTSATGLGPDGFPTSFTDGTCVVQFVNGQTSASSGGPTGTNTTTPVRDGDVHWLYQPTAVFIADAAWA